MSTDINDRIFCLEFETQTLAGQFSQGKLERWVPGFTDPVTDFDHVQRYEWACRFVNNKAVLDMACGAGKGSYMLAANGKAKHVLGCDLDKNAIRYASIKHTAPNLLYEVHDAQSFKFPSTFDVIISFETIEHLPHVDLFLNAVSCALHEKGCFIVSTPVSQYEEDLNPHNPFHVKEWGFYNFQKQLEKVFTIEKVYIQMHVKRPYTFSERLLNRLIHSKKDYKSTTLCEYVNQIPVAKFGKQHTGYQILVCRKKA